MDEPEKFELAVLDSFEMTERMQLLQYKVQETRIGELWNDLDSAGFKPLLIKGWAAAQVYPQPHKRQSVDIDIAVDPAEYFEAKKFLAANPRNYTVDLHRGLRRHDTLPFGEIYESARLYQCGETQIRAPREEDHLRILCVHWLTDGGAYRQKLWDIFYAVERRSADFDWERLLQVVSRRRRRWIVCTIGLAHKYLELEISDTPIAAEAKKLPRWLIDTIEREWLEDTKLLPLAGLQYSPNQTVWSQIKNFLKHNRNNQTTLTQIRKRLLPNPILATVDVEGDFDAKMIALYQVKNFLRRLKKFGMAKDE